MFYVGARSQPAMERKRRTINRWAASQCGVVQVPCIHHPQFKWSEISLYLYDGIHLSPLGNQLFISNLREFIISHNVVVYTLLLYVWQGSMFQYNMLLRN